MAVIQSLVDTGTEIQVTIEVPVKNVDVRVNFYSSTVNGEPAIIENCLVRPISPNTNKFVVCNSNRDAFVGQQCYAEVVITQVGFPSSVLLDEQSAPIAVGNN